MSVLELLERGIDKDVTKNPWRTGWLEMMDVHSPDIEMLRKLAHFRKHVLHVLGKHASRPVISSEQAREYAGYLEKLGIEHDWDEENEKLILWMLVREDSGSSPHAYQEDTDIIYRYYIAETLHDDRFVKKVMANG